MKSQRYTKQQIAMLKGIRAYVPFFVCIFISAVLWVTREMGKTYQENVTLSMNYVNMPKSLSLISQIPSQLTITVESTGWGLMKHYLFDTKKIDIDISEIESANIAALNTKDERIVSYLGDQLKVMDVYPSEITFYFEKIHSKKVPVVVPMSITYERQYEANGEIVVSPDTITIYGSHAMIDTITRVTTEQYTKKKQKESFRDSLDLIPIANVAFSSEKVVVSADVEKFTEQTVVIPITLINAPTDGLSIQLLRDKVSVSFLVGLSNAQSYFPTDFEAVADYQQQSSMGVIPVEIIRYPQFVRIVRQDVSSVGIVTDFIDSND